MKLVIISLHCTIDGRYLFTYTRVRQPHKCGSVLVSVRRSSDIILNSSLALLMSWHHQRRKLKSTIFLRIHFTECTEMKVIHHFMKACASRSSNRSLLVWPLVSLHHFPCFSLHVFSRSLCSYFPFPSVHFPPPPFLLRSFLHHSVH